jgi:hypothetical protein
MTIESISYIFSQAGPILRWLAAIELQHEDSTLDRPSLLTDLLACDEVQHWMSLLGGGPLHHSMDCSVENVLAKLGEYGLRAGIPELDKHALPYCAVGEGQKYHLEALIIVPFLVRLGYASEPQLADWIARRIDLLYDLACRKDYDLYMDEQERSCLPPSQRMLHGTPKLFYKLRFNHHWGYLGLPTCYDLFTLAYLAPTDRLTRQKIEKIVSYLLDPAYQNTAGGYIWNIALHRPYAAGRVFLACLPQDDQLEKLVLFMEMLSQFESGRSSSWFQEKLAHLETFRTERGTYLFPSRYLTEKHNYYLYAGMHMGLGEWPRKSSALELESTFRMLRLKSHLSLPVS